MNHKVYVMSVEEFEYTDDDIIRWINDFPADYSPFDECTDEDKKVILEEMALEDRGFQGEVEQVLVELGE